MSAIAGYKYAVQLLFDTESEHRITGTINTLREQGLVNSKFIPVNYRPHISLACYRNMDEAFATRTNMELAQDISALMLQFTHSIIFSTDLYALCYGMPRNRQLTTIHQAVHDAFSLQNEPCWEHYLPANWDPHCGLLIDKENENIIKGAALLADLPLPVIKVQSLCVTGFKNRIEFALTGS